MMTIYHQLDVSTMIRVGIFSNLICALSAVSDSGPHALSMFGYFKNSGSQKLCKVRVHIIN
jgi:hypothetical protein